MIYYVVFSISATETRSINQTVKRNFSRFPAEFMFQLTNEEWDFIFRKRQNLKS